jgi:uncharacterized protein (TIGR03437 family)
MKLTSLAVFFPVLTMSVLHAQTPTITKVIGEAGDTVLSPGGIAFVQGSNLGGGAIVTVGDKQAYVFNTFPTSLQLQLPVDAPLGATTLKVGASAPFGITLVQYSPGLPVNNPGNRAAAMHWPSGAQVTPSFPASPNERIAVGATGLGPTDPAYGTGKAPSDNNALALTKPTVNIAGTPVAAESAFLQRGSPGFYLVVFTMPSDVKTGNQNISIGTAGLTSNTGVIPVATGPIVSVVSNAASYITLGPRRGIAKGAVFVVTGTNMGPSSLTIAPKPFQETTLSGTSVSVTVNGTTVAALMYYTSAKQVSALLPSNTPSGAGTITVTYNGDTGPAANIVVVTNNVGIFTVTSDGQGSGIVTYPDYSLVSAAKAANCGGLYTTCGAANPGDVLTIWATGLGPVDGRDQDGSGLGVNMTAVPLTIWLGNVAVKAAYQGRSGCCIGEDQIVFTVPPDTPTGCNVPLSIQTGNGLSNSVALPVAPAGTRNCSMFAYPASANDTARISSVASFTYGGVDLHRNDQSPGFQDGMQAEFLRITPSPALMPFFLSYVDEPALGTCQVYNTPDGQFDTPVGIAVLNAGPQISVQGPNGTKAAAVDQEGTYGATLSSSGDYFTPGTFAVSGAGGSDVPAFNTKLDLPVFPTMTAPQASVSSPVSVTRADGLNISWSGSLDKGYIQLYGYADIDNTGSTGLSFECSAPAAAGSFTIPPAVLMSLPPVNGGLAFRPNVAPANLTGTGLDVTRLTLRYETLTPLTFK